MGKKVLLHLSGMPDALLTSAKVGAVANTTAVGVDRQLYCTIKAVFGKAGV